jgi:hypothetical protein
VKIKIFNGDIVKEVNVSEDLASQLTPTLEQLTSKRDSFWRLNKSGFEFGTDEFWRRLAGESQAVIDEVKSDFSI